MRKRGFEIASIHYDESMIKKSFGDLSSFYQTILNRIDMADPKKIFRDTGELLGHDYRNWVRTSFIADFKRLVSNELSLLRS